MANPNEKPGGKEAPKSADEKRLTTQEKREIRAKLIAEKDEKVREIKEEFEKRMRKSNEKTSEIAIGKWKERTNKELRDVLKFYKDEIDKLDQYTVSSTKSRESLAEEIMERANDKANARKIMIVMIMERHMSGEYVTTEEVAEIDMALEKMAEFQQKNPHIEKLYKKIKDGETLEESDYNQVIDMFERRDLKTADLTTVESLRASNAGILMGAMSIDQRKELAQQFMKSKKKADTEQFIDMMISMGLLGEQDALEVLEGSSYKDEISKKIENGTYKKRHEELESARKEYQQQREQNYSNYRGRYNKNIVEKVLSGKGLLGLGGIVWGFLTTSVNILASRKKGEKFHQWIGRAAKNPYVYAGLAGMAAGAEITGSNLKAGTWFGAGPVSRVVNDLMDDKEESEVADYKANARKQLAEIKDKAPQSMMAYLENGGYNTVQQLRAKIDREKRFRQSKKMPLVITIDELITMETNPDQISRLQSLKGNNEQNRNNQLTTISEAGYILQLGTNEEFIAIFNAES